MRVGKRDFTLGTLVLANFGAAGDLVLPGRAPAEIGACRPVPSAAPSSSSWRPIFPLADRQLQRVARRAGAGLARLGAFWGDGSGDVALGSHHRRPGGA